MRKSAQDGAKIDNANFYSRLLQFVTGTSRVPMNGFKELYGMFFLELHSMFSLS